ncbi:MAG: cytochrome c oxidase accessory protein CcoG [Phycisphaerales bacterium]|nr:cytochrome c oxidase accessory protein CcoG [Phycisphaerales bacterium]
MPVVEKEFSEDSLLQPEEQVLSTLNADGSRRWMKPRLSTGSWWTRRRIMAYGLIAIFTIIPYIHINGNPAIQVDLVKRELHLFGFTFLPTDTVLLALFMVSVFVTIFLLTAIFGRVWCGWACPQTVYLEFVYRPIERVFQGGPGRKPLIGGPPGLRAALKFIVYVLISLYLAHTFLAYFVGVDELSRWVRQSPLHHPTPFLIMLTTTGLMLFDFGYFREQTCIVACPYGRFQSVLLDRHSLIISYDEARGEPRGKPSGKSRRADGSTSLPIARTGDCIDCGLCVSTCPTGIDIRKGLQMECVACAQCIDACDNVMTKIGKPKGLIRYGSQSVMAGGPRKRIRPRVIYYPTILAILLTAFTIALFSRGTSDALLYRGPGSPFTMIEGEVLNVAQLRLRNRDEKHHEYKVELVDAPDVRLEYKTAGMSLDAGESIKDQLLLYAPRSAFTNGKRDIEIRVSADDDYEQTLRYRLLGPFDASKGSE